MVAYKGGDIGCHDVAPRGHKTERGFRGLCVKHNAGHSSSQCLDRAEPRWARGVVNGGTSLSIFLVVHVEGDGISGKQLCKGGVLGSTSPLCQNVTSWRRNWTVRVQTLAFGIAYSPTRSKKKKAVVTRSAVALVRGVFGA